jgi:hypothetical protein
MGKLFKVTYDSENGRCFKVHTPSGIALRLSNARRAYTISICPSWTKRHYAL